jgi:hypothetical protein
MLFRLVGIISFNKKGPWLCPRCNEYNPPCFLGFLFSSEISLRIESCIKYKIIKINRILLFFVFESYFDKTTSKKTLYRNVFNSYFIIFFYTKLSRLRLVELGYWSFRLSGRFNTTLIKMSIFNFIARLFFIFVKGNVTLHNLALDKAWCN